MVPEAAALTSVKPRETNAPRRWKSEYGTEGIKEPALRHICALCVWICVEKMNLCVPSLRYWGFFRDLFQKQCHGKHPAAAAGVWFSLIQLSLYLVFYCIRRGVKIQLCLECTGGFLGVNSCKCWSQLLQGVSCF